MRELLKTELFWVDRLGKRLLKAAAGWDIEEPTLLKLECADNMGCRRCVHLVSAVMISFRRPCRVLVIVSLSGADCVENC